MIERGCISPYSSLALCLVAVVGHGVVKVQLVNNDNLLACFAQFYGLLDFSTIAGECPVRVSIRAYD